MSDINTRLNQVAASLDTLSDRSHQLQYLVTKLQAGGRTLEDEELEHIRNSMLNIQMQMVQDYVDSMRQLGDLLNVLKLARSPLCAM